MCVVGMESEHVCVQAIAAREGARTDATEEGLDVGVDARVRHNLASTRELALAQMALPADRSRLLKQRRSQISTADVAKCRGRACTSHAAMCDCTCKRCA
jgi:hypothetical protein